MSSLKKAVDDYMRKVTELKGITIDVLGLRGGGGSVFLMIVVIIMLALKLLRSHALKKKRFLIKKWRTFL